MHAHSPLTGFLCFSADAASEPRREQATVGFVRDQCRNAPLGTGGNPVQAQTIPQPQERPFASNANDAASTPIATKAMPFGLQRKNIQGERGTGGGQAVTTTSHASRKIEHIPGNRGGNRRRWKRGRHPPRHPESASCVFVLRATVTLAIADAWQDARTTMAGAAGTMRAGPHGPPPPPP